jgi:hypothetical protein
VTIELFPGAYTLNLFGYINDEQPPAAKGSRNVAVYAGQNSGVSLVLDLEPISDDFTGSGIFEWNVETTMAEGEIKSLSIEIARTGEEAEPLSAEAEAPALMEFPLDAGYYNATVTTENIYGAKSVSFETLWIYPNLRSTWDMTISAENFFAEYGQTSINWTFDPDNPPVLMTGVKEVYQGDVIVFDTIKAHTTYSFFVDGKRMQSSESASFRLDTKGLLPGSHDIAIIGINEKGIPWSTSVRVKVLKREIRDFAAVIPSVVINESATDSSGNIYLAAHQNDSGNKALLIKLSPDGNELWRKTASGSGQSHLSGIALGGDRNIYVSGAFTGTLDFGAQPVTGTSSIENPFVASFDANGNNQWISTSLSGTSYGGFGSIAVDETGIYCAGMFYHSRSFAGGVTVTSNSWANFDSPWIVKFDFAGQALWGITSTQNRCASISDITVVNNTVYACGYTNGSGNSPFQWDSLPVLNATGYNFNGWTAAFDAADGRAKWASLAPLGGSSSFGGISVTGGCVYAAGFTDPSLTVLYDESGHRGLLAIYDAGSGSLISYTDSGINGSQYSKVSAAASGIYAAGSAIISGTRSSVLDIYKPDGTREQTFTASGGAASEYRNVTADGQTILVAGNQTTTSDYRYDGIDEPLRGTSSGDNGVIIRYVK